MSLELTKEDSEGIPLLVQNISLHGDEIEAYLFSGDIIRVPTPQLLNGMGGEINAETLFNRATSYIACYYKSFINQIHRI